MKKPKLAFTLASLTAWAVLRVTKKYISNLVPDVLLNPLVNLRLDCGLRSEDLIDGDGAHLGLLCLNSHKHGLQLRNASLGLGLSLSRGLLLQVPNAENIIIIEEKLR